MQKKILRILTNKMVAPDIFKLELEAGEIAGAAQPGQFVHVKHSDATDPLLRRPFSINNITGSVMSILYHMKGKGTKNISALEAGGQLDVIGPLGNGFQIPDGLNCLVVAGGIGIAPMRYLINKLAESGNNVTLLYGCGSSDLLVLAAELSRVCRNTYFSTDDGSAGTKGFVTDVDIDWQSFDRIYSCGPEPMLKAVSEKAASSEVDCFVSLERHMACGVGACLGCVCNLKDETTENKYSRVCIDGPVYDAKAVKW